MDFEAGVAYYGFSHWTKAAWGQDFTQIARRVGRACQFATCDAFPTLNRSSRNRMPPHLAMAAIVLPSESVSSEELTVVDVDTGVRRKFKLAVLRSRGLAPGDHH
jgi:hypothetical protein